MNHEILGFTILFIGSIMSGVFALPMKFQRKWAWEKSWFVYSFWSTIFFPVVLTLFVNRNIFSILAEIPLKDILVVALFGFIWGIGSVLFGLGLKKLGLSIGYAIMMGLINAFGTLIPIAINQPDTFKTISGLFVIIGLLVIIVGIIFLSRVHAHTKAKQENIQISKRNFISGLIICIITGIIGPFINFAFVFGSALKSAALAHETLPFFSANIIWFVALITGFIPNAAYCLYLMKKNKTYKESNNFVLKNHIFGFLSGLFWFASVWLYGVGVDLLGTLGVTIGWAFFQSFAIIAGNFAGGITGDWKNLTKRGYFYNFLGIAILILGVFVLMLPNIK